MVARSRISVPITEEIVEQMASQVMEWPDHELSINFRALERYHVSILVLVFFGPGESRDRVIFRLSGMPGTMFVASVLSHSPRQLMERYGMMADEMKYIVRALYRLQDELLDRRDEYPLRIDRPAEWQLSPIALPPGDSATAFTELSKIGHAAAWNRADFLFPYERPVLAVNRFNMPDSEKMCFTFTLAGHLHSDDVGKLRHYMAECSEADMRMLAQLEGNTIGGLLENTAGSIERRFGLDREQVTHLLRGLHSLEYSLIFLSEIKRRGLVR